MQFFRFFVLLFVVFPFLLSFPLWANEPEKPIISAMPNQVEIELPPRLDLVSSVSQITFSRDELQSNPALTEGLLNQAIERNQITQIENLLGIYRTFLHHDDILVRFAEAKLAKAKGHFPLAADMLATILRENPHFNPVRIELAILLFLEKHDSQAQTLFEQALKMDHLPQDISILIQDYLLALKARNAWQISGDAGYLHEKNINKVSDTLYIENTPFRKGESMLPQKANGVQYGIDIARDVNLFSGHYLSFKNTLYGKTYWDNHDYDDITNRTYLGYRHQSARASWALLPFYERQWYGGHRYKKALGLRAEGDYSLSPSWQLSIAIERSQGRYHSLAQLNGHNTLFSFTALWRRSPQQYFYGGIDTSLERPNTKRYAYDYKALRLGWVKNWSHQITTRIGGSLAKRAYRDHLILGNVLRFNHARKDRIYTFHVTLWKRDWHFFGVTPKLHFSWKKQQSNFDTLYSYIDRNVNVLIEKSF